MNFIQDVVRARDRSKNGVGWKELIQLVSDISGMEYSVQKKKLGLSHYGGGY